MEGKCFVVIQCPKAAQPMTRYPYKFKTRLEAEQFREASKKVQPDCEFMIDELNEKYLKNEN